MVTILHFLNNVISRRQLRELPGILTSQEGVVWIDLDAPNEAEEETVLVSLMDFHPLAVEDCQRGAREDGHLPKVEDFSEYLFVIFNPIEPPATPVAESGYDRMEIVTAQLSAFLGPRVLVTHHYKPLRSIDHARRLLEKTPLALGRGPDYLFHAIIDDVVDNYTPILDRLDEVVDAMEDDVFERPNMASLQRILQVKKNITTLRRIAVYQREMLNRLSRGEFELIAPNEAVYYRNVYDHLVRMTDLTESYRDVVSGILEAYLSVTSNNLNRVMKVLTIISTIFLPLSVITGFFGMNFKYMPGADWEYGVTASVLFMAAVASFMVWIFRRNKWI